MLRRLAEAWQSGDGIKVYTQYILSLNGPPASIPPDPHKFPLESEVRVLKTPGAFDLSQAWAALRRSHAKAASPKADRPRTEWWMGREDLNSRRSMQTAVTTQERYT